MAIIPSLPNDIIAGEEVDAEPVMANFNAIVTDVNANAAANGANSDITSLSGLTTPLSVFEGGTGSQTAPGARTNLGAAVNGANNDITSTTMLQTIDAPAGQPLILGSDTAVNITTPDNVTLQQLSVATAILPTAAVPLAQIPSLITGVFKTIKIQNFTSNAIYTPSAGMAFAYIKGVAGGGCGGSANVNAGGGGQGGGAGQAFEGLVTAAQVGASQAVTIGAGGITGTVPTGGTAGQGGNTIVGSLATIIGGFPPPGGQEHPGGAGGSGGTSVSGVNLYSGCAGGTNNGDQGVSGEPNGAGGSGGPSIFGGGGQGGLIGGTGGAGTTGGGGGGNGGGIISAPAGSGGAGFVMIIEVCTQ